MLTELGQNDRDSQVRMLTELGPRESRVRMLTELGQSVRESRVRMLTELGPRDSRGRVGSGC